MKYRSKNLRRILTVFLVCVITLLFSVSAFAGGWITVYYSGNAEVGGTLRVAESTYEASDELMMAYFDGYIDYVWATIGGEVIGYGPSIYITEGLAGTSVQVTVSTNDGSGWYGFSNFIDIGAGHSCSFSGSWEFNDVGHWKQCSCGATAEDSSHTFGSWTPTGSDTGEELRACTVCRYTEFRQHTHSYSAYYYDDAVDHWKECSCGARTSEGPHTYGPWAVLLEPTPTTAGVRSHVCSVCGLEMREPITYSGTDAEEEEEEETPDEEAQEDEDRSNKKTAAGTVSAKEEPKETEEPAEEVKETAGKTAGKEKPAEEKETESTQPESAAEEAAPAESAEEDADAEKEPSGIPLGLIAGIAGAVLVIAVAVIIVILRKRRAA